MINEFHNTREVPVSERETFNNTVLLLTMVKSEYYYIVGFSRPDRKIEIAFDFDSDLHGRLGESITVDFGAETEHVVVRCALKNINAAATRLTVPDIYIGDFSIDNGEVFYNYRVRKDRLIPVGMEQMHEHILKVKSEIVDFLEKCYRNILV